MIEFWKRRISQRAGVGECNIRAFLYLQSRVNKRRVTMEKLISRL